LHKQPLPIFDISIFYMQEAYIVAGYRTAVAKEKKVDSGLPGQMTLP
jgi:hypothetical protein